MSRVTTGKEAAERALHVHQLLSDRVSFWASFCHLSGTLDSLYPKASQD